ncbi:restriction endonuclease subunit S [Streptococcus hyointestinalis]|uniref:restriction endonuclease subunit S n=1 Tax=Streptococcus hyointestinalis TaxID=1337 RepID=UPI003D06EA4B
MKTNSVPKIRFKGFTDDWEQRKLGEISSLITKGTTPKDKSGRGEVNFIKVENIDDSSGEIRVESKISLDEHLGYLKRSQLKENDILFSIAGTLGRVTSVNKWILPANTNQALSIIRLKEGSLEYVKTCLKGNVVTDFIRKNPTVGAQPNLSLEQVSSLAISMPSEDEQQKIGAYFSTLDRLITLHQRKCDQTKELKKFMLQKMFPKKGEKNPEIRFSGFTDDWEQRKLGEFGKATGGISIESEFSENGKYKVISIGSYSERSTYNDQGIRVNKTHKIEQKICNKNDLTMILNDKTASGNIIGRVLLIDADDSYVFNQRTERIEVNQLQYNSNFLYSMLNADGIRSKIIRAAQGNTQIYVNWSVISRFIYLVPLKIAEQTAIGNFFSTLDNLITLHQRKCEQLKELKKFMLQNMFPKKG